MRDKAVSDVIRASDCMMDSRPIDMRHGKMFYFRRMEKTFADVA